MTNTYDRLGIRFSYPENWLLEDEETKAWPRSISVHSPSGGFWSLLVYDQGEPQILLQDVKSAMAEEYDDMDVSEYATDLDRFELTGYEMNFYCLDFVVSARAVATQVAGQTYLLIWQAEDAEFIQLESVFHAISTSLFRSIHESLAARRID